MPGDGDTECVISENEERLMLHLFEYYSSLGDPLNKTHLSSGKFLRFLRDAGLVGAKLNAPEVYHYGPGIKDKKTKQPYTKAIYQQSTKQTTSLEFSISPHHLIPAVEQTVSPLDALKNEDRMYIQNQIIGARIPKNPQEIAKFSQARLNSKTTTSSARHLIRSSAFDQKTIVRVASELSALPLNFNHHPIDPKKSSPPLLGAREAEVLFCQIARLNPSNRNNHRLALNFRSFVHALSEIAIRVTSARSVRSALHTLILKTLLPLSEALAESKADTNSGCAAACLALSDEFVIRLVNGAMPGLKRVFRYYAQDIANRKKRSSSSTASEEQLMSLKEFRTFLDDFDVLHGVPQCYASPLAVARVFQQAIRASSESIAGDGGGTRAEGRGDSGGFLAFLVCIVHFSMVRMVMRGEENSKRRNVHNLVASLMANPGEGEHSKHACRILINRINTQMQHTRSKIKIIINNQNQNQNNNNNINNNNNNSIMYNNNMHDDNNKNKNINNNNIMYNKNVHNNKNNDNNGNSDEGDVGGGRVLRLFAADGGGSSSGSYERSTVILRQLEDHLITLERTRERLETLEMYNIIATCGGDVQAAQKAIEMIQQTTSSSSSKGSKSTSVPFLKDISRGLPPAVCVALFFEDLSQRPVAKKVLNGCIDEARENFIRNLKENDSLFSSDQQRLLDFDDEYSIFEQRARSSREITLLPADERVVVYAMEAVWAEGGEEDERSAGAIASAAMLARSAGDVVNSNDYGDDGGSDNESSSSGSEGDGGDIGGQFRLVEDMVLLGGV